VVRSAPVTPRRSRHHLETMEQRRLDSLFESGRYHEVERALQQLLARQPDSGLLWKTLSLALKLQHKDALPALQRAAHLLPQDAQAHHDLGDALRELGRPADAVPSYQRALQIKPDFVEAHNNLGVALQDLGAPSEAAASYRRGLALRPDFAETHNNLGNALRRLGRPDDAVASYRRALALRPDFAAAHSNLGIALQSLGLLEEAVACYRAALEKMPQSAETHNNLGNALRRLGRPGDAVASYRRALEIRPEYAEAYGNLGNAQRDLGRLNEAESAYRRALEIRPEYAEAHSNLGNAQRDLGRLNEAESAYRRALEIRPEYAEAHNNLGSLLLQRMRAAEAAVSFRQALTLRYHYPEAHSNLGAALVELGRLEEAVGSYHRALELMPDYADAHNNLGNALRALGRLDEAANSYRRALEIKSNFAEAHSNLGVALRLQRRAAEAEAHCQAALALEPNLTAALALRAELLSDRGHFEQSEMLLRRVLAVEPEHPHALAGIARCRRMTRADAAWLADAQRLAERALAPAQETYLRYAIGKYFDDVGDYAQAFASYRRANELLKRTRPPHDRERLTCEVDALIDVYDRHWLRRAQAPSQADALPTTRPIFIVGMPRSGTSLVEQILASHPSVFGAGELPFWGLARMRYEASVAKGESSKRILDALAAEYLQLLQTLSGNAEQVVDKMPRNFMFLGLILAALPSARIIHLQRHPADTCLSIYFQHFENAPPYTNDLEDLAHYYREYLRVMDHWRAVAPPDTLLDLPYESLIEDQGAATRKVLSFVGLPWDARCLDFHRTDRSVITASKWQVRQKVHNASVGRWQHYAQFIRPLQQLLQSP
jgi:tetratricopeptide (TPR) repeat protein